MNEHYLYHHIFPLIEEQLYPLLKFVNRVFNNTIKKILLDSKKKLICGEEHSSYLRRMEYKECSLLVKELGCPWNLISDYTVCNSQQCIRGGYLEHLKYLRHSLIPKQNPSRSDMYVVRQVDFEPPLALAALCGQLEIMKYLHSTGHDPSPLVSRNAAANGHLECLKYALSIGGRAYGDLCSMAFVNGHLECMKFIHETLGCRMKHNGKCGEYDKSGYYGYYSGESSYGYHSGECSYHPGGHDNNCLIALSIKSNIDDNKSKY